MEDHDVDRCRSLTRRAFLRRSLAGASLGVCDAVRRVGANEEDGRPRVRIGLVTDLHYADKPAAGTRHYRETPAKFAEAARRFREESTDLVVELGDLIDGSGSPEVEKEYLKRIVKDFAAIPRRHRYVLGNHCVGTLTKPEFLGLVGQERSYDSFDLNGTHFIALDACFRGDGQPYGRKNFDWKDSLLAPAEVEWLRDDLRKTPHKTVVFIHQRLDAAPPHGVKNAPEVRKILEESRKVLLVLQGHSHQNDHKHLGGIHYVTLAAMVEGTGQENNAYALLDLLPGDAIRIRGFRRQKSYGPW